MNPLAAPSLEPAITGALKTIQDAQAEVQAKTYDFFFTPAGTVRLSEDEVFAWVADRTIDEYKVGFQAAELLQRFGHMMEPWLVNRIGEQVEEETKHYRMLFSILPLHLQDQVRTRMRKFPTMAAEDARWNSLINESNATDYVSALLEISLVFEGFASAAIQSVLKLPYPAITKAYSAIFRDEQSHHDIGVQFVHKLCATSELVEHLQKVAEDARVRARNCTHYEW